MRRRWVYVVAGALVMIGAFAALLTTPLGTRDLIARPRPAADYAEAMARLGALQAADGSVVNPACRTRALVHGRRVERVVVLLHGYTNCPEQFLALGQALFERGDNVIIPRYPYHGYADRLTDAQERLTALHLILLTDEAIDIARGLGDRVTVGGLSVGGTLTAWAAQARPDIDRAVVMAPLFGLKVVPAAVQRPAANLFFVLPNLFIWWDQTLKERTDPSYAYPRFASRGIGEVLRLSDAVWESATARPPGARSIVVVTSAADEAIDNGAAEAMAVAWRARAGIVVRTHEFPADLGVRHDFIDPNQPYQQVERVYPILIDLLVGPRV